MNTSTPGFWMQAIEVQGRLRRPETKKARGTGPSCLNRQTAQRAAPTRLPDGNAFFAVADHRIAGLALERSGEGGMVGGRTDRTEIRRGMRIGD